MKPQPSPFELARQKVIDARNFAMREADELRERLAVKRAEIDTLNKVLDVVLIEPKSQPQSSLDQAS